MKTNYYKAINLFIHSCSDTLTQRYAYILYNNNDMHFCRQTTVFERRVKSFKGHLKTIKKSSLVSSHAENTGSCKITETKQ